MDGAGRDAKHRRNLANGHVAVVAENDHDSVVGRELPEPGTEHHALVGSRDLIAGDSDVRGDVTHAPTCRLPKPISARVDEDAGEPGIEASRIPELVPVLPRADERVVSCVLRVRFVVQDRPREPVAGVEVPVGERTEGGCCCLPTFVARTPTAYNGERSTWHFVRHI